MRNSVQCNLPKTVSVLYLLIFIAKYNINYIFLFPVHVLHYMTSNILLYTFYLVFAKNFKNLLDLTLSLFPNQYYLNILVLFT